MQLAPGPSRPAVLLLILLALAEQLQAGAVDRQVRRAVRDDLRAAPSEATAAAAQCGVVRDTQLLPEQPKYTRSEALGLAQGKVEDKPEHQHQLDRRVRVPGLTAGRGPPRRLPACDGGLVQPECQVAAPLQTSLVSRPVLDPIAGLRDAVTARGIVLERHARDRNRSAAAGPPAPAPDGSMHLYPGRARSRHG